jgi:hypothetical protein
MYFENVQYLYLLPLTALPLIIYLIFRKKPKKMIFSSLFLLKDITQKANRRTRLKDILLLILRTLLLLALIMIFASPFVGDRTGFDISKRTVAAVFFDTSSSMADVFDGETKAENSRNLLIRTIIGLPENSTVHILTSDPEERFKGNTEDAVRYLNSVEIYGKNRNMSDITAFADSLFVSENGNNQILLAVTDGYLPFSETSESKTGYLKKAVIYERSETDEDVSIDSVQISERKFIFLNLSSKKTGTAVLDLFQDGKKIYSREMVFENAGPVKIRIELSETLNSGANLSAVIRDEKGNMLNDTYNFVIPPMTKKKMLILSDENSFEVLRSVKALLRTGEDSLFIPDIKDPKLLNSVKFSDYSMIFFLEMSFINPFTVSGLKNYISNGGSAYFVASDKLNLNDYNTGLIPSLEFPEIKGYEKKEDSFAGINLSNTAHPVFSNVFTDGFSRVGSVEIYQYYKLSRKAGWENIIISGNDPVLIEKKLGRGRIFFLACGLDKSSSNIMSNGISVPLLLNSFIYLAGSEIDRSDSKTVGDQIISDDFFYAVEQAKALDRNKDELIKRFILKKPGFYKIYSGDGAYEKTASVNYEREDYTDNSQLLKDRFSTIVLSDRTSDDPVLISFENKDLKIFFLISLALIVCAEILIVRFMK